MSPSAVQTRAWVTLLTRPTYTAGVLILAYTLQKHKSKYPLIVLITPTLPHSSIQALELEASQNALLRVEAIETLIPPAKHKITYIADRFEDTWAKLRVFSLTSYETIVFLDADIAIMRNMDDLFSTVLPGDDWLAANHACVCNLDKDNFAPGDWNAQNCAYTKLQHPSAMTDPTKVPHSSNRNGKLTHRLLNSGMFLFHPSEKLWKSMLDHFHITPKLATFQFPDQDFLADFFADRWVSVGWQYNALKTMRYWHENVWRDDEVRALHYIVDKPWQKRIASDGIAGHLGRDRITHSWWWALWDEWRSQRGGELIGIADTLVAKPLDVAADKKQCREHAESKERLPVPVPAHPGMIPGAVERNGLFN